MATTPKSKKITPRTEHLEQAAFIAWKTVAMDMQTDPAKRLALRWTHAVPNGYYRSPAARMKGKREGVTAGILDLSCPAPELAAGPRSGRARWHGLYIEMKRRGEKLRQGQSEFMDYLDLVHYRNALCYSWQCAARLIVEHLDLRPGTYPEIILEGEDDRRYVAELTEMARAIDLRMNPPKRSRTEGAKRKARPRRKAAKTTEK